MTAKWASSVTTRTSKIAYDRFHPHGHRRATWCRRVPQTIPNTFNARLRGARHSSSRCCEGPIAYDGHDALERDCVNLRNAVAGRERRRCVLSAASPGVIARFIENRYYPNHRRPSYLFALANAMKTLSTTLSTRRVFYYKSTLSRYDGQNAMDIPGMAPGTDYLCCTSTR